MKKTIVAMLVSGTILFPGLSQAQTLEQSVAQSLATHPKIKEAFDLYQARLMYRTLSGKRINNTV